MIYHQWLASGNHSSVEGIAVILPQKSEWSGLMIKGWLFTNHTRQPYLACSRPWGSVLGLICIIRLRPKQNGCHSAYIILNELSIARLVVSWSKFHYRQVSNISSTLVENIFVDHSDVENIFVDHYIFILHLTLCFNILHKDHCKPRRETFDISDLVHRILEILWYFSSYRSSWQYVSIDQVKAWCQT